MKSLELTHFALFEPMLDFTIDKIHVDLHNDYDCCSIEKPLGQQKIVFYFIPTSDNSKDKAILEFDNALLTKSKYPIHDVSKAVTLSNFHRGKFLTPDKILCDTNEHGQHYYYLSFFEGQETEIFAEKIIFSLIQD